MINIKFRNHELEKLANGVGDHKYPKGIAKRYRAVLSEIEEFVSIRDILTRQGWSARWKQGDRADQVGIRLNDGRRLLLKFPKDEEEVVIVALVRELTNHYE